MDAAASFKVVEPATWPVIRWADIEHEPPVEWQIEDVLPAGGLAMGFGGSGAGKTFVFVDMGLHIAAERPWHGKAVKAGGVLYIAAEAGRSILRRVLAWRDYHSITEPLPFHVCPQAISLETDADVEKLVATVKALGGIVLIVVDTLARVLPGEENSATDVSAFIRRVDQVREKTGAGVLLIHHSGKDTDRGARGSSALRAAVDSEFEVTASEFTSTRTMRITKLRDGEHGDVFPFRLEPSGDSCVAVPTDATDDTGRVKLTDDQVNAMRAFHNHLIDGHLSHISVEEHTVLLKKHGVITAEDPRKVTDRANKLRGQLQRKNKITVYDGRVYLPK